ncbi:MAG: FAD-dependent oxidoreductase [Dehalococcoidia bacterium]|nr:FAD-dependent oxidoreductase [Dehalococcoidia bacterium]
MVVERESAAHGASGTAAGILSPPSPALAKQPGGQLSARGIALHRELAEELGGAERWDYRPLESAVVARNKDEVRELERTYGKDAVGQVQSAWADKNAMAAVPLEGAAQLDPGKFTQAMLEEACANGAEVMIGDVQGIRTEQGSVTGVQVSAGTVETGRVVVAMGPWASESEGWLRTPVPVTPLKGQILHLEIPYAPDAAFSTLDGNYAVRKPSGVVYAGTTEEDTGFDRSWTEEALDGILGWARTDEHAVPEGEARGADRLPAAAEPGRAAAAGPGAGVRRRVPGDGPRPEGHRAGALDGAGDGGAHRHRRMQRDGPGTIRPGAVRGAVAAVSNSEGT